MQCGARRQQLPTPSKAGTIKTWGLSVDKREWNILICGLGSIGERHFHILKSEFNQSPSALRQTNRTPRYTEPKKNYSSFESVIEEAIPDVVVITTPTSLHMDLALKAARSGCHLFIEKPVSHNTEGLQDLIDLSIENQLVVMVGYMMRFHPLIMRMKSLISSGELGAIIDYKSCWGEYLPSWHPWEDHRKSYAGRVDLGGGPRLTLSHDVDLLLWFNGFKNVELVDKIERNTNKLEIETAEEVELEFRLNSNSTAQVKLSFLENPPRRNISIKFEKGSLYFDYFKNSLSIERVGKAIEVIQVSDFHRDQLFRNEWEHFFQQLLLKKSPSVTLQQSQILLNTLSSLD